MGTRGTRRNSKYIKSQKKSPKMTQNNKIASKARKGKAQAMQGEARCPDRNPGTHVA